MVTSRIKTRANLTKIPGSNNQQSTQTGAGANNWPQQPGMGQPPGPNGFIQGAQAVPDQQLALLGRQGQGPAYGPTVNPGTQLAVQLSPEQQINEIYKFIDEYIGTEQQKGSGSPGNRQEDVKAALLFTAKALYKGGLTTPKAVKDWVISCRAHDNRLILTAGTLAGNAGYHAGMTAAAGVSENDPGWVSKLPKTILENSGALGALVGVVVGGLDVIFNVVGGTVVQKRLINEVCWDKLPLSLQKNKPSDIGQAIQNAMQAAALNIFKNGIRMIVPGAMLTATNSAVGLINKNTADSIDVQVDGIGGYFSNAANNALNNGWGEYATRLLTRNDIEAVIKKSKETFVDALKQFPGNVAAGFANLASAAPVVMTGVITGYVAALFASNASLGDYFNGMFEKDMNMTMPNGTATVDGLLVQRANSMAMMGAMSFTLPLAVAAVTTVGRVAGWFKSKMK